MKRFGMLLSETMDATMREVFGESASELIYRLMERQASLTRDEVGERIEAFHAFLRRLLGSEVAHIVLANGLKLLLARLRREYEEIERYFSFLDELYEIKLNLLAPSSIEERSECN